MNLFSKDGNASFEVPKNSGKHTIYNANIWLGGLDEQDNLHLAAHLYHDKGDDYFLGPITKDYTVVDGKKVVSEIYKQKYYRTWKVSKAEIEYHKANYSNSNYQMPPAIANWPAHGRTQFGESANLAPYIRVSASSTYNPAQGDYPDIKGDETVLFIMNDDLNTHTESGGARFGVNIIGMAYAFNSPDTTLQHTVFLQYKIINKSPNNYKNFYLGFFSDFDIGFKLDDFMGCYSKNNLMFAYNGKEVDGTGQSWAYGFNPPAQGASFLNQRMSAFLFFNDFPPNHPTSTPEVAMDYYNYLRAIWKDGTPMTYYGTGYNPGSIEYTNFMYDHSNLLGNGIMGRWTENEPNGPGSSPNAPYDRRGIMSTGPFNFPTGGSLTIDIALPFARAEAGGSLASLGLLLDYFGMIHGKVEYNQMPFYSGDILLYGVNDAGQYSLCNKIRVTPQEGFPFRFGVFDGNYIIKVIPDSTDNFLPTYYGNTEYWSEATIVSIVNRVPFFDADITMVTIEPLHGSSTISGYVGETSGGKKSILSAEVNIPIPDVSVYLQSYKSSKWTTIAHAITNEEGFFVFEKVPIGSYRVTLDIPGIEITNPPKVEITEDGQIVDDIFFEINLDIVDLITKSENKMVVYPNPSNGHFTITSEKVIESIELYDVLGKKVFSDIPKTQTIQINAHLPQGLYIYRAVLQGGSISSGKIIVQ